MPPLLTIHNDETSIVLGLEQVRLDLLYKRKSLWFAYGQEFVLCSCCCSFSFIFCPILFKVMCDRVQGIRLSDVLFFLVWLFLWNLAERYIWNKCQVTVLATGRSLVSARKIALFSFFFFFFKRIKIKTRTKSMNFNNLTHTHTQVKKKRKKSAGDTRTQPHRASNKLSLYKFTLFHSVLTVIIPYFDGTR